MNPIELVRYKLTNPEIEIYTKCYEYGSSSWKVIIIIIIVVLIIVLIIITSVYCFSWHKETKVKPHQKIETPKTTG